MRNRILSLVAAFGLLVPGLALAGNSNKAFNDFEPTYAFQTPGCCIEVVDVNPGIIHLKGQTSSSNNGNFKTSFHFNFQNVTGVGDSSGDPYLVALTGNFSCAGNYNNGSNHFKAVFNGSLTDVNTSDVASITVTIQFVVNANGDVTAAVENISVVCPYPNC